MYSNFSENQIKVMALALKESYLVLMKNFDFCEVRENMEKGHCTPIGAT